MAKKILCMMLALLLSTCALTACGSKKGGEGGTSGNGGGSGSADTLSPEEINVNWAFDWTHGYEAPDTPVADSVKNLALRFEAAYDVDCGNGITVRFEFPNEYCKANSMLQVRIIVTNNTDYALTYAANNKELYLGNEPFLFESDCVPPAESLYYAEGDTIYGSAGDDFLSDPLEREHSVTFERIYWVDSADFEALLASGASSVDIRFTFKMLLRTELTSSASVTVPVVDLSAS